MQPPDGPVCISRITLYSKIWRGFDRGLYAFFKAYIFLPICAPSFSTGKKILGVLLSYTFVLLWHGFQHQNIVSRKLLGFFVAKIVCCLKVWIGLNLVGLFLEYGAKAAYSVPDLRKSLRSAILDDRNFRRLLAVLQIVPFAFGLYSNFYFLGGSRVGWLFVKRVFLEETVTLRWPFFLLIFIGYFYMQTSQEIERLHAVARQKCPFERKETTKKS